MTENFKRLFIVDDDADDIYLVKRAISLIDLPINVAAYNDGQEFVNAMHASAEAEHAERRLALLDINMPRLNGFEALRSLTKLNARNMPIVMFSTSREQIDIDEAYRLGANGYVGKPNSVEEAGELVRALYSYWLVENIY